MDKIYENAKIVIIDDVEQILKSTKNRLEFEGMNVECFSNPIDGLEYLKKYHVDVLLLDFFMPEMNGDEFVEKLREFNQQTIIILQTGYSDKIPPLEMIDKMNIQGYIDKIKGQDELVLMTKAAIKTAQLNKKIVMLNQKKAILGELISHLVNESKNQLFQISSMNETIKNDTDVYDEETKVIKKAVDQIYELYEAINFENCESMSGHQLEKTVSELLKAKLLIHHVKLSFNTSADVNISNNANGLIYFILNIIDEMINNQTETIHISVLNTEGKIQVCIEGKYNNITIDKDNLLIENAKIEKDINKVTITL